MQEDFVQKAESQLEVFHQTTHSFSDTASQSDLNATQTSSQGPAYSLKQLQQKAPAPTTRHLRQILRTGSKSARQVSIQLGVAPFAAVCLHWFSACQGLLEEHGAAG